jgi:hypothetical protein
LSHGLTLKHYTVKTTWRDIATYPLYEMSAQMEVREKLSGRMLVRSWNNKGYHYHLLLENKVYAVSIEKLVGVTFPELRNKHNEFRKA